MNAKFWQTTAGQALHRAFWLAISAALAGIVAATAKDPRVFGTLTPVIYFVTKTALDYFSPSVSNTTK